MELEVNEKMTTNWVMAVKACRRGLTQNFMADTIATSVSIGFSWLLVIESGDRGEDGD